MIRVTETNNHNMIRVTETNNHNMIRVTETNNHNMIRVTETNLLPTSNTELFMWSQRSLKLSYAQFTNMQ